MEASKIIPEPPRKTRDELVTEAMLVEGCWKGETNADCRERFRITNLDEYQISETETKPGTQIESLDEFDAEDQAQVDEEIDSELADEIDFDAEEELNLDDTDAEDE